MRGAMRIHVSVWGTGWGFPLLIVEVGLKGNKFRPHVCPIVAVLFQIETFLAWISWLERDHFDFSLQKVLLTKELRISLFAVDYGSCLLRCQLLIILCLRLFSTQHKSYRLGT